jgi:hypothetical protein
VLEPPRLLVSSQRAHIHLLRLYHLALLLVEAAEIVDRVQRRCVFKSPRLLPSSQCPHVHLLRLHHLALVDVEEVETFERAQRQLGCSCIDGEVSKSQEIVHCFLTASPSGLRCWLIAHLGFRLDELLFFLVSGCHRHLSFGIPAHQN